MKKHRVFVAILLPEAMCKKIMEWQEEHAALRVRWKKSERLHITIVMPWYADKHEIRAAKQALASVAETSAPFSIEIQNIRWGPPNAKATPRLIWADGKTPKGFKRLKTRAQKALRADSGTGFHSHDKFPTIAHVTVANFKPRPREALPSLNERVCWRFEVRQFQLIESIQRRGGTAYRTIASFDFS